MLTLITLPVFMSLAGAQAIFTLALFKGEICPGQRGRLHTQFILLNITGYILSFIYLSLYPLLFISQLCLSFFIFKNKKRKTSTSYYKFNLYLSNIINLMIALFICFQLHLPQTFILIAQACITGGALAWLLVRYAHSRLTHFMTLMPYISLFFSIILIINIPIIRLYYQSLNYQVIMLCLGLMSLLAALFFWLSQVILNLNANKYFSILYYFILLFSAICINKSILL